MKTLYILGNGFDIHHELDTRYQSFAKYLAETNLDLYEQLQSYYGLPDVTSPLLTDEEYALWSRFEEALADLDYEGVLEDFSDLIANPGAEDFRDRDWHSYQIQMELVIESLTKTLIRLFNNFILEVDYSTIPAHKLIQLEEDSHFLSFNYTKTLHEVYDIHENRITYIHNKATNNDPSLILGHGTDPSNFVVEEEKEPEGLTEEQSYEWRERKGDEYDSSYESAKQEILTYYTKAFKNTSLIIQNNVAFFDSLSGVEKVIVLGHSLSPVDMKYIEKLKENLSESVIWTVSFYGDLEKQKHLDVLTNLGIDDTRIIQLQISDLK